MGKKEMDRKPGEVQAIDLPGGVKLELCWIPSGEFRMGSPKSELGRWDKERRHSVTISQGFWMGKYQVTQAQWKSLMDTNPSEYKGDNRPIEKVSWDDIQEFIRKLNAKTGKHFCLPTSAEWEYACRAGTETALNSGKNLTTESDNCPNLDEVAWYAENSNHRTHAVGQKKPNAWGLYDMHGNVEEWCQDLYFGVNYLSAPLIDPTGPLTGNERVLRGGSIFSPPHWTRAATCLGRDPRDYCTRGTGFRLALKEAEGSGEAMESGRSKKEKGDAERKKLPVARQETGGFARLIQQRQPGDILTIRICGLPMDFCWVPPGTFLMGSPDDELKRCEDEGPRHPVTISRGFWMGKYPVTQNQWAIVTGWRPSRFNGGNRPVEQVSWKDVQNFISMLNANIGKRFRLPTEAEWEYACRAGTETAYSWGNSNEESTMNQYCWYDKNANDSCWTSPHANQEGTQPVGKKKPNAWKLFDMHGNVAEWCSDWYDKDYYRNSPSTDPQGPSSGDNRVRRGGSWVFGAGSCRSAARYGGGEIGRVQGYHVGFRLVVEQE